MSTIKNSEIISAVSSEYDKRLTRVWTKDGNHYLVTNYRHYNNYVGWIFDDVVGTWTPGPGGVWLGPTVKEHLTVDI